MIISISNKDLVIGLSAFMIIAFGFLVFLGWIFDIPIVRSVFPNFIEMKILTSIGFMFSGVMLYCIYGIIEKKDARIKKPILKTVILAMFFIVILPTILSVFGIKTGIENIFVAEPANAINTVYPGLPAFPTLISFTLLVIAGFLVLRKGLESNKSTKIIGIVISLIGSVGFIGYLFGIPILYYYIPAISTAIALNTTVLFMLVGAVLFATDVHTNMHY